MRSFFLIVSPASKDLRVLGDEWGLMVGEIGREKIAIFLAIPGQLMETNVSVDTIKGLQGQVMPPDLIQWVSNQD